MTTYLITGVTGGIGSAVLKELKATLPPTDTLIAASSSPSREKEFTSLGVQFRVANYNDEASLLAAFKG